MGKQLGGSGAFWRDKQCASDRATGMEGSARLRGAGLCSILALNCVSASRLFIQCRTLQVHCQLWLLSQINSAKQEQDVLASFPGARWVLAVPPGEPGKGKAPLPGRAQPWWACSLAAPGAPAGLRVALIGDAGSQGQAGCRDVHLLHSLTTCPAWHKPS